MLAEQTAIKTIYRELHADLETPTSLYLKLRGNGPSFLLESVEGGEQIARYSFIGVSPRAKYVTRANQVTITSGEEVRTVVLDPGSDPTHFLEAEMQRFHAEPVAGLPRFVGGMVGYLGYETVRHFEPKLATLMAPSHLPDAIHLLSDTVVAFDHARRNLFVIAHVIDGDEAAALRKLDEIETLLRAPLPASAPKTTRPSETRSNMSKEDFEKMVRTAKEYISAGDIFQVVLSQRFSRKTTAEAFDIYRAVRRLNPSP